MDHGIHKKISVFKRLLTTACFWGASFAPGRGELVKHFEQK